MLDSRGFYGAGALLARVQPDPAGQALPSQHLVDKCDDLAGRGDDEMGQRSEGRRRQCARSRRRMTSPHQDRVAVIEQAKVGEAIGRRGGLADGEIELAAIEPVGEIGRASCRERV